MNNSDFEEVQRLIWQLYLWLETGRFTERLEKTYNDVAECRDAVKHINYVFAGLLKSSAH